MPRNLHDRRSSMSIARVACNFPCSYDAPIWLNHAIPAAIERYARMFVLFRPEGCVLYEHMFCSPRTSKLTQRARDALALTRAFLLLEDDDPVDWEVGEEEFAAAPHEPAWAPAHRASLCERKAPRRGGQLAAPPQVCLSPIPRNPKRNISHRPDATAPVRSFAKYGDLQGICRKPSETPLICAAPRSQA